MKLTAGRVCIVGLFDRTVWTGIRAFFLLFIYLFIRVLCSSVPCLCVLTERPNGQLRRLFRYYKENGNKPVQNEKSPRQQDAGIIVKFDCRSKLKLRARER